MQGMVAEWDEWRRGYEPTQSALIVHGPNDDVDLINELAQRAGWRSASSARKRSGPSTAGT
jgi:hypothetical protein